MTSSLNLRWLPRAARLLALGLACAASTPLHAAAPPLNRPNILFIFADDHAYQAISAYHDPRKLNQTPNIDRLATEGMLFQRCLVPNSICGPCRAIVMTGKYSHLNGFYNNVNSRFDGSQTTFPKLLHAAGYQTGIVGKWHLISDPTGFDYWETLPGQGVYYNPPTVRNGQPTTNSGYITDLIADRALDWLKQRDAARPFLLMVHNKAPHREWSPALRHLNHDGDRQYPEPPTLFDDYSGRGKGEHEQQMTIAKTLNDHDLKLVPMERLDAVQRQAWDAYYGPRNAAFEKADPQGKNLVRWKYNRYLHDYLGCVKAVDEGVGQLLNYLDQTGLATNTIVVYSSDQGFYLGEHGWFDKRWIFEESLRTPLLVRWPGVTRPGSVNTNLVSVLDFAETFLDAAGQAPPAEMQGRSLVPLLKGQTPPDWRKSFYYHYYEHPAEHNVPRQYGVVTERYKLVHFYEPEYNYWELFDLQKDPQELKSVFDDPTYAQTRKDLEVELARLRQELKVPAEDPPVTYLRPRANGPAKKAPKK